MHQLYAPPQNVTKEKIVISDSKEIHHIKNVLRLKTNDPVSIFDGCGSEYTGKIKSLGAEIVIGEISSGAACFKRSPVISIACALPKKSGFDDIIDKLTQLGVEEIIPLECARTIVKLDSRKKSARVERWNKIALNASKQSKVSRLPVIQTVRGFKESLSGIDDYDLRLIPTLMGERKPLGEILFDRKYKKIFVLIGPEGDFTCEEVALARKAGFIPVSLGGSVLRVETAAVALASFIRLYYKND